MSSLFSDEYRRVVGLLIAARKNADVTQEGLAELLGRPQSFVSKYERFERRLDVVEFLHLCQLIGTDPYDLLRSAEPRPETTTSRKRR